MDDHRVLDRGAGVAGQHHAAALRLEAARVACLEHLDAPVLGARRGAAQIQAPATVRGGHQGRALQRLSPQFLAANGEKCLEVLAVGRAGDRHGVTPPHPIGTAQPVRQVGFPVAVSGAWGSSPGPRPGSGRRDGDDGTLRLRYQGGHLCHSFFRDHIETLDDDLRSSPEIATTGAAGPDLSEAANAGGRGRARPYRRGPPARCAR